MNYYVHRRTLRWLGHVAHMPFTRIPRKMLTAWVRAPRFRDKASLYYGNYVLKCLERAGIDKSNWFDLTQDRDNWRSSINDIKL